MPFDGNGNYSPPVGTEGVPGEVIDATPYNALLADLTAALSSLLRRAGDSAMTGNLPMGGYRVTGMANGSADGDAVNKGQLDDSTEALETSFDNLAAAVKTIPMQTSGLAVGECFKTTSNQTLPPDLPVGNVYEIYNSSSSTSLNIAPGSGVTLYLLGSMVTGAVALGPRGLCFIKVLDTDVYGLTGPGVHV